MNTSIPMLRDQGNFAGRRVILRTSLNVPLKEGAVRNDFRLEKALATIRFLKAAQAKILIFAHLGRDGESLRAVYEVLKAKEPMQFAEDFESPQTRKMVDDMRNGDIILFENLRRDPREEANDPAFAEMLASLGDIYVNDAFADSHRAHASIVGIPTHLPGFLGLLFEDEITHLSKAFTPQHPSLFILGGAKFETKRPLLEKCIPLYDHVFVGGALANDFFKAHGYETGKSRVSDNPAGVFDLMRTHDNILLPTDVITQKEGESRATPPEAVLRDELIVDAGPQTIEALKLQIANAKCVLWNGPLGNYEVGFNASTEEVARAIANSGATSIVGGGDTVAAIASLKLESSFTFLSTGGGAMLDFLATGTLPGIAAAIASPKDE